jgi:hypothetical protein
MPVMDGIELCRKIRAQPPGPYTYFMMQTIRTGLDNFLQAMEAGVDDFITKPIVPEELLARLKVAERILGLREELMTLEGLLAMCSYCKRIRDTDGAWTPLERYVEPGQGAVQPWRVRGLLREAPEAANRRVNRGGGIRTRDLLVPNQARYRTAPHPENTRHRDAEMPRRRGKATKSSVAATPRLARERRVPDGTLDVSRRLPLRRTSSAGRSNRTADRSRSRRCLAAPSE